MNILALIFDGFEEEEAMAPFALLRRAGANLVIASNNNVVTGCHNISISNVELIDNIDYKEFDCLLVPGGPHFKFLRQSELVHKIIKYFFDKDKVVAGICAAPTIFGMLGYLKNKKYTCFTSMNDDFKGIYLDNGVVVDGNLITGKSVAYSIDFAYAIVEKTMGRDALEALWKKIYYEK